MEKKTNKAKLEIFKFLRKSVFFDKISGNCENLLGHESAMKKAIAFDHSFLLIV